MFAAGNPLKQPLLLCVLRVLCVKENLQPPRGVSSHVSKRSYLFSSLFPQNRQNINLIYSTSSALFKKEYFRKAPSISNLRTLLQNTGGGTSLSRQCVHPLPSFSTASKHRPHRNACVPRIFKCFRTVSITGGWGAYRSEWDRYSCLPSCF